ncbi:DUF4760 domain-containing protein [Bradyrhizobium sp. WSM1417]|uniref:DUF4760 domain-containing protein n=1 Tax=Bradyrhizobium sp. WSM1417 TaxID=754500 RepID=UPI000489EC2D|nr:DUF4760 domain-containing protein [Bradyrhizobium sp. WSM1417]
MNQGEFWGTIPQWFAALIALGAAIIAFHSISVQRQLARKRATIDFFLKASMDKECLDTYDVFKVQVRQFKPKGFDFEKYITTEEYKKVRVWLNICELIAVGINRRVFDDRVAFDCWGDLLPWCYDEAEPLISWFRETEGSELSYIDLDTLSGRWQKQTIREAYATKAKKRKVDRIDTPPAP